MNGEATKSHNGCFEWPVRVYYEDTDAAGIVYHVITHTDLRYQRAARFNEELRVVTTLKRLRGVMICRALNGIACVDALTLRPRRIPPDMMRVFESAH